ncbi:sugar ABC transporter permease [Conexibacter sp. JD483]|uniref:carbohydrate ABC transporter permease n=1 Tax=unclassified Conexibacter TaxID=2627773 RepID=UPI002723A71E|nr:MULTISPECIES: sugar ABC transporter permease [unclassified Conexibacter]MDO8189042.1 sugar ABC transporter permease [Conexibacter sp. CPCC 205706]MDO8198517.1 sugar ABC transporter permease [Conexibacter sp. CPCC 205762]MDR9367603.1 sugar ABC transporter permease [Conexibacter sp. JD483]
MAPALLLFGAFVLWPIARTGWLSLHDWNLVSPDREFVGLDNYSELLGDPDFHRLLGRTLMYVAIGLVGGFLLPVGLAMLTLRHAGRATGVYQTLLFVPTVITTAVGALVWQFMYLPSGGPVNELLDTVGISPVNWLKDPSTALPAVGVVGAWQNLGFSYMIALAGLSAVSPTLLEAAELDGASGWQLLRHVVLPLLMPTLLFLATTAVLHALPNVFVAIEILTSGGPAGSSSNLLYDVYSNGLRFFRVGEASAEAVVLMALIGGAAVWQMRLIERGVTYER